MIVLGSRFIANLLPAEAMARRKGFEPLTIRFEVWYKVLKKQGFLCKLRLRLAIEYQLLAGVLQTMMH